MENFVIKTLKSSEVLAWNPANYSQTQNSLQMINLYSFPKILLLLLNGKEPQSFQMTRNCSKEVLLDLTSIRYL